MVQFEKRSCELRKSLKGLANLCCKDDLRQKLMGVFFDKGFMVATDAHGLLKVPAKVYGFLEEELELLEGKIIPSSVIKELSDMQSFGVEEGVFKCYTKKGARIDIPFNEIQEKFVDYESVIQGSHRECEVADIGLNADVLKRVQDAMPYTMTMKLTFNGHNKAILVESNDTDLIEGMIGVVMPCIIDYRHS